MFGKAQIKNSNVWTSENQKFQSWKWQKEIIPMFGKDKNSEFQCLEERKSKIPMFGKEKVANSNIKKSPNWRIRMFRRATT